MKKQVLLLAGSILLLASCSNEPKQEGPTKAQIDSTVNAKVAEENAMNAAKNDSILRAAEAEKAMLLEREKETTTTTKTKNNGDKVKTKTKTTTTETVAPPVQPTTNPKENRFKAEGEKTTVDPASTKKKEDRFK